MPLKLAQAFATFFGVGYFPLCPGSAASVIGLVLAYFLAPAKALSIVVFLTVTLVGFVSSDVVEKNLNRKDPSLIVIDEVAGILLAFFYLPFTWDVMFTGFFLFRAFDMFKIYPIDRLENISGGAGVMLDDLLAGLYTNLTMQAALALARFWV